MLMLMLILILMYYSKFKQCGYSILYSYLYSIFILLILHVHTKLVQVLFVLQIYEYINTQ